MMKNKSSRLGAVIFFLSLPVLVISILPMWAIIDPNNKRIRGDSSSFDPIEQYETVRQFAGDHDLELVSIEAKYVRRDGTLDLNAEYEPNVEYIFNERAENEEDMNMPMGTVKSHSRSKKIIVTISKPYRFEFWTYLPGRAKGRFYLGMYKESYDLEVLMRHSKKPNCSLKKLWDNLSDKDIPQDAVATIKYEDDVFKFGIQNTPHHYQFDCNGLLIDY